MRSRLVGAVLGVLVSVGLSALLWVVFDVPFLFLVIPFVPFLLLRGDRHGDPRSDRGGGDVEPAAVSRHCPACGFRTSDPSVRFCPRDGTELRGRGSSAEPADAG